MSKKRTRKNIYLPKWQRYYIFPMLVGIWGLILWIEFFTDSQEKMGTVGIVIMSGILILVGTMTWLMTSGKLPAYVVEEVEEYEDEK